MAQAASRKRRAQACWMIGYDGPRATQRSSWYLILEAAKYNLQWSRGLGGKSLSDSRGT
jgi:hypothetical protein